MSQEEQLEEFHNLDFDKEVVIFVGPFNENKEETLLVSNSTSKKIMYEIKPIQEPSARISLIMSMFEWIPSENIESGGPTNTFGLFSKSHIHL